MLSLAFALALQGTQPAFSIHDGDRVLFYGDSITDNAYYPQFVEQFILTRFPKMKVTFLNYGWSGDRVTGGAGGDIKKRLTRDVYPHRPTMITIMLGMNDGNVAPWNEDTFHKFADGYEDMVRNMRQNTSARFTFVKPSAYDDVTREPSFPGGYNGVLVRFGDFLGEIASQYQAAVADFNKPIVDLLTNAKAKDPAAASQFLRDRIHPNSAAHIVMGAALLKAWNAPQVVSSVEVDAATKKASAADNAEVRDVQQTKTGLAWRTREAALPLYFFRSNPQVALALASSTVEEDLNREALRVTGLADGTYNLTIDGNSVGQFAAGALATGIDLSRLDTPMLRQSASIFALTEKRQSLRWTMWRTLVVSLEGYDLGSRTAAIRSMERLESEIIERQRREAQPRWHNYALEVVTGG